ncbi:hypothetical protein [Lactobacillus sp. LL6]|uniref:hypothetical protein n=1 Tax=Lactobacillus sp. LL6 TaxID=2596827 RepID=UPI00118662F5|nr:hypothetical protein [Lactobacillus sp. LL6]TSO25288.1 hypothetical protein FOD82_08595 [Lactobacillus sp. LL6]
MKRLTQEEFERRVDKIQHSQYKILEKYINRNTKIKVKCLKCSKIMSLYSRTLMEKRMGKDCNHHLTLTEKEVKERINKASNHKIEMVESYQGARTKIKMHCKKCNYTWKTQPYLVYNGHDCPSCANKAKVTDEILKNYIKDNANGYELIGSIVTSHTPVKILHKTCGHIFEMTPKAFMHNNQRCPYEARKRAAKSNSMPLSQMKRMLLKGTNDEYKYVKEYKSATHNAVFLHTLCGHIFKAKPTQLVRLETGCPYCSSSKGEKAVREYLIKHGFEFKEQVKFDSCRNQRPLPFDFGIYHNKKLEALIEYQGVQHYEHNELFDKNDTLNERKHRDEIKRNWCKANHIPLIEISCKKKRSSFNSVKKIVKFYLDRKLIPNQVSVKTEKGVTTRQSNLSNKNLNI